MNGYIVEVRYRYGTGSVRLSADSQTALVSTHLSSDVPKELRIWAYNQGGESPTVTIPLARRRAVVFVAPVDPRRRLSRAMGASGQ